MTDLPMVSIIIPTYNSAKTLAACLESVKKQSYQNIELIVVDNNSTDNTKDIAKKYTDKVFNQGPERSAQRNFGVAKSTGEYVLIIDSDMELSVNVVKACVEKAQSDLTIKGIIIPEESFGQGFWAECKKLERSFYVGVDWMEAARFFEKQVYQQLGGYDETMISGEDWDFSQRVGSKYKLGRIVEFIYHNEGSPSLAHIVKKKFYYAKQIGKYKSNKNNTAHAINQTSIFSRYGLFFSQPKKLFTNPSLALGMLFMKTCEFGFGALSYLIGR